MLSPASPRRVFCRSSADLWSLQILGALLMTGWLVSLQGCAGINAFRFRNSREQLSAMPRPRFSDDPQLEEVVDHLNQNVRKLHSWQANSVKIRANNMPLSGTLAVEEGQHLRLVVQSIVGHEVDMGSNDDVFWIWAKRMEPSYVYCRHDQIEGARQALGVPFEPGWLMQALGVAPIDTKNLTMQIDPSGQHARLVQPVLTAHGHPIQKVMHVDLVRGVITEHSIYDARGARVAQAHLDEFRVDKQSGAVLPRRVRLDWPQNQMSLVMNLGQVEINSNSIPPQIWDMPHMPGVQMVDLGKEASGIQIATRDVESEMGSTEPESPTDEEAPGHFQLTFDGQEGEPEADEPPPRKPPLNAVRHQSVPVERPIRWDDE